MTLAQKFSSAMNGIDDEFIEEALTYERSKKRKPSCVLRIVLVAALISVLLFTSALAFSPSLRENTLNVLVEIFSDHATFCVEGDEPAGSYIAGKIDYSALEETYRLDPEGCYRVDFASGATFFGNNGEIISITVVAIRDGLVVVPAGHTARYSCTIFAIDMRRQLQKLIQLLFSPFDDINIRKVRI